MLSFSKGRGRDAGMNRMNESKLSAESWILLHSGTNNITIEVVFYCAALAKTTWREYSTKPTQMSKMSNRHAV